MVWSWLAVQVGIAAAGAIVLGATPARKGLGALLLATAIAVPAFARLNPLETVVLCFASIVWTLKITQIAVSGAEWSAGRRLWHLLGVVDTRQARRASRRVDVRALGWVLLNAVLAAGALIALAGLRELAGFTRIVAWVLAAATFAHSAAEVLSGLVHAGYRASGFEAPTLQRRPILSRSLAEFWGQRWNSVVGGWLREFVFQPLARRKRPQLGLAASFGASGLIHAWLIVALGIEAAAMMAAYFVVHGAGLLVESRMGLRRAPAIVGRLWTIGMLLIPLPLLLGPWTEAIARAYLSAS